MIKEKIQINVSTVGKAMRERGGGGRGWSECGRRSVVD